MTIDAERIARDRALMTTITDGPWTNVDAVTNERLVSVWHQDRNIWTHHSHRNGTQVCVCSSPMLRRSDAAFIAAARTLLPEYITEVERLQCENARLRQALEQIRDGANINADRCINCNTIEVVAAETLTGGQP